MNYNTKDVFSAIKLAEKLKTDGEYDFFRGQRHSFEILPSLSRSGVDKKEAIDKLGKFSYWVHDTPELESLHYNQNAILSVAQHYGLKTNLIDFSYSPNVAGFFATDQGVKGDIGTIICLNRKKFEKSWHDLNNRFYEDNGNYLVEIIEIDVKNLWRLQAQEGLFLKSNVDYSMLEMFSCFQYIYFPQDGKTKLFEKGQIYPQEKSHLEILLDQYFLIDSYPDRQKKITRNNWTYCYKH